MSCDNCGIAELCKSQDARFTSLCEWCSHCSWEVNNIKKVRELLHQHNNVTLNFLEWGGWYTVENVTMYDTEYPKPSFKEGKTRIWRNPGIVVLKSKNCEATLDLCNGYEKFRAAFEDWLERI